MNMVNVIDCEDCGLVVRTEFQAYNQCGDCGGKAQEIVISNVSSKILVSALITALEKETSKASVIGLLERVEADQVKENGY